MFTLDDVDKRNFNAVLRRSLVWRVKARFEDPQVLESAYADIAKDGVFPKDPDLQAFLTSGPAVAAGLQMQHSFEMHYNKEQCIDLIENYVSWGGDGGLTEDTMRSACRLPPIERRTASTHAAAVIRVEDDEEDNKTSDEFGVAHRALVEYMLARKKAYATIPFIKTMKVRNGPNLNKEALVEEMKQRKLMQEIKGSGKADAQFVPMLRSVESLENIIQHTSRQCEQEFQETYKLKEFAAYMNQHAFRRENAEILATLWQSGASKQKRAGRVSAEDRKRREELLERAEKCLQAEKDGDSILDELLPLGSRKRRRQSCKAPDLEVKSEGEASESAPQSVTRPLGYHYPSTPGTMRSRKQVNGLGAQKFPQRMQMFLFQGTHDLDIENSVFTLLAQLLPRLELSPSLPDELFELLRRCAMERAAVCEKDLGLTIPAGKKVLTAILYGGHPPKSLENNNIIQDLQRVSLYLRWVAASACSNEFQQFCEDGAKRNPDSSILSHVYMACEDFVLSHWTHFLLSTFQPNHLSLHFDGVRISDVPNVSVEEICRRSEAYIEARAGFKVRIREKKHALTLALLEEKALRVGPARFEADHILRKSGNCILHALACAHALPSHEKIALVSDTARPETVYLHQRGCRTYKQCVDLWGHELFALPLKDSTEPTDKFLLHLENGLCPHCVGVNVPADPDSEVTIWDADKTYYMNRNVFQRTLLEGVDYGTGVLYFFAAPEGIMVEQDSLMGLGAAGADSDLLGGAELPEESSEAELDASDANVIVILSDTEDEVDDAQIKKAKKQGEGFAWLDDMARPTVEQDLLKSMSAEIDAYRAEARAGRSKLRSRAVPCPACPFRRFDRCSRLLTHLQEYHTQRYLADTI